MKSLILAGFPFVRNFGDNVIHQSSRFILEQAMESSNEANQFEINELDLQGLPFLRRNRPWLVRKSLSFLRILRQLLIGQATSEFLDLKNYYSTIIEHSDLVVIAGGGIIKFKHEKVWLYLRALIAAAEKRRVPMALNSVGVEGFDTNDSRCLELIKSLNSPMVKIVTTRDDIATLRNLYLKDNNDILTEQVADPAVWASEIYGIEKDEESNIIGIGIIRGGIFKDHGISFEAGEIVDYYVDIIKQLSIRNMPWRIFTNGAPPDFELAKDIFDRLEISSEQRIVLIPSSGLDLVNIISKFRGVIAARLHANIIAYSLDIPSIGIVWNNKLKMYGDNIGYPERFMDPRFCDGKLISNSLLKALAEGYEPVRREKYRQTIKDSAQRILRAAQGVKR